MLEKQSPICHNSYLCGAKAVLRVINIDGTQKLLRSFLAIDELSLRDSAGIQDSVSVHFGSRPLQAAGI